MTDQSLKRSLRTAVLMACAPLVYSGAALAQTEPAESRMDTIQEVIVTAQKREEDLQKVPISMVALDVGKLENLQIAGIADIGAKVPNVRTAAYPYSPSTIRVFIRGIGYNDANLTTDASVGIYFNGVYVGRSAGLSMDVADLERMEILRGPQGTLYGRNTIGGAVNMITAKPTGEFGIKTELSAGNYDFWKVKTQVNLPSVGNLSTKFAYMQSSRGGLVKNIGSGPDFGEDDKEGLMLAFNWKATDALTLDYIFDKSDLDYSSNYYQATTPDGSLLPFIIDGLEMPYSKDPVSHAELSEPFKGSKARIYGHNLTAYWELSDALALKSVTAYRQLREQDYQNFSANPYIEFFSNNPVIAKQQQFSQEFQLIGGQPGDRFTYVAGVYYFRESGSEFEIDTSLFGTLANRTVTAENSTAALYGQGTYSFTDQWRLTVGARYTRDKRETTKDDRLLVYQAAADRTFSKFTPSASIEWLPADNVTAYGKVVTGFKSGGFNLRAGSQLSFERGFDPEKIISYELGLKSRWLDNRLQFNTALFHMDFDDIQLGIPEPGNPSNVDIFNAGKAKIDGVEIELTAVPFEGLLANLSYAYLDSRITEVKDPFGSGNIADAYVMTSSPKSSLSADVTYTFPRTHLGEVSATLDYSWQDKFYTQNDAVAGGPTAGAFNEAYGLLGARLTLADIGAGRGKAKVSLWGRNLLDEDWGIDTIGSFNNFVSNRLVAFGAGRTYGVDVSFEF